MNKRYTWVAIAVGGTAAVIGGGVAMYEGAQNRDAAKKAQDALASVQFQADPYVAKTQDFAFPYYTGILNGNIPDYYKGIGETGSPEAQKMLALTNRDITNSANEGLVRRGMSRSGVAGDVISQAIGDSSTKFNYADYQRAMAGKQWLMGAGETGLSNVRSAALTNQSQMNSFNISKMGGTLNAMQMDTQQQNGQDAMWGQLLSSGVGAIGNYYGMQQLKDVYNPAASVAPSSITGSGLGGASYSSSSGFGYSPTDFGLSKSTWGY